MDQMRILDMLGLLKENVDEGDASIYKTPDQEAIRDRFQAVGSQMQEMSKMPAPNMELMRAPMAGQQPMMPQQTVNPYAPVNYGTMQYQMAPMGGIGSRPTLDQVLAALAARQ